MYEIVDKYGKVKWSIHEPTEFDNVTVTQHDCRVYTGDVQHMSFSDKEARPLPPFNFLDAPNEDAPDLDKKGNQKK